MEKLHKLVTIILFLSTGISQLQHYHSNMHNTLSYEMMTIKINHNYLLMPGSVVYPLLVAGVFGLGYLGVVRSQRGNTAFPALRHGSPYSPPGSPPAPPPRLGYRGVVRSPRGSTAFPALRHGSLYPPPAGPSAACPRPASGSPARCCCYCSAGPTQARAPR